MLSLEELEKQFRKESSSKPGFSFDRRDGELYHTTVKLVKADVDYMKELVLQQRYLSRSEIIRFALKQLLNEERFLDYLRHQNGLLSSNEV